ncbi:MAG: DUF2017 family protein [Actinomycetota bacterium]
MARRGVRRTLSGRYAVRLSPEERNLLRGIPAIVRGVLDADDRDDPVMRRLFPSASLEDPESAAAFDALVRGDLDRGKREHLEALERTADAERLTEEELLAWLGAVNDVRLVLGVRLGVSEDSEPADFRGDEEAFASYALYGYLTWLEDDIVRALAGSLPNG